VKLRPEDNVEEPMVPRRAPSFRPRPHSPRAVPGEARRLVDIERLINEKETA
jgi:hypothetical protein